MTKIGCISFFLCCYLPFAFGNGILVEQASAGLVSGEPGEVVTVVLRVENETGEDMKAVPSWQLPDGWQAISSGQPFSLPAKTSILQLFSVHIAQQAKAASFPLQYRVSHLTDLAFSGTASFQIKVKEIKKLNLMVAQAPEFVVAGEEVSADFVLQNLSNKGHHINLVPKNCLLEENEQIYLEANETKVLKVRAATMPTLRHSSRVFMKIHANITSDPDAKAYASRVVRVLPQAGQEMTEMQHLPVRATLSHLLRRWKNGQSVSGFQGELYAQGSLDEAGKNQVELLLRGPNQFELSQLGRYDEYYASFENEKVYAHLGDKTYTLTPLTEFSRFGRGIEASITDGGGYEFGGYYQRPRFFPGVEEETAGYIRFHYAQGQQVGFNAMHKKYSEGRGDAVLMSLHGTYQPWGHTSLEGEISRGHSRTSWGSAFLLRGDSRPLNKLHLATNFIYADKFYPGYFTNSISFYAQASYQLSKRLSLQLHLNQDERNAARDTLFGLAPWSRLYQFGAGYKLDGTTSLRGYLRHNELKDRMPGKKFHFKEDLLRLQLVKNWNGFRLSLTGETGKRENLLKPPPQRFAKTNRAFFNINYRISQRLSVNAMAQYYWYNRFSERKDRQWIFGGGVNSMLTPFTRLHFSFQNNYLQEEYYRNRSLLDLDFSHQFGKRKNHEFSFSCNYTLLQRTQEQTDFSLQTNYSWNFGLRTQGKKASQGVYGQILNKGAKTVEGILLHLNGRQAMTDSNGSFSFENVPPGRYFLMLDPTTINLHDIADVPIPMEVVVEAAMDKTVSFGLTRSANLTGKIELEPEKKKTGLSNKKGGQMMFMFEMTNGKETYRRISGKGNQFEFTDLRPGKWTLRILNDDGYRGLYFERTEWELELLPDESKELKINLLRKKRKIRFQDQLSLTSSGD
ncbi:MAG TPA: hypothetical protein ENJ95_24465 [Bacteroidetes bacterium]|nr:hypothetical protein [Bacteroidota bacterium]